MRRAFVFISVFLSVVISVLLVTAALVVGGAPRAHAGASDRAAARILDAIPLPPTAQPDDIDDRARSYTTADSPDAVLAFFREQLATAGWNEKSVTRAAANNDALGRSEGGGGQGTTGGGTESSGEGTPGAENAGTGGNSTANEQLSGPIQGRWTMDGALLRLRIDDTARADQQVQGEQRFNTTFVLRARPPR